MGGRRDAARQSRGQQIQAAEQEAARRRILALAEVDRIDPAALGESSAARSGSYAAAPRVAYGTYLLAVALTLARRHRPVWSWRRWRWVCRCGADLPCPARHRVPVNGAHWSAGEER